MSCRYRNGDESTRANVDRGLLDLLGRPGHPLVADAGLSMSLLVGGGTSLLPVPEVQASEEDEGSGGWRGKEELEEDEQRGATEEEQEEENRVGGEREEIQEGRGGRRSRWKERKRRSRRRERRGGDFVRTERVSSVQANLAVGLGAVAFVVDRRRDEVEGERLFFVPELSGS